MIPLQLQLHQFRFIKIKHKEKIPLEKDWQNTRNYKYNDPNLQKWIEKGNYGICTGYGNLIVIDFDEKHFQEEYLLKFPKTFTVKSGSGLLHLYFLVERPEKGFKILDKNKNTLADIQGTGKQIVAPGSTHPNGYTYKIIDNSNIAKIEFSELKAIFGKHLKQKPTISSNSELDQIKSSIKVSAILKKLGVSTDKNPTSCPFHGSKGGKCLSYDDELGLWNCFHCEEGGDIFNLVMLHKNWDFAKTVKYFKSKLGIKTETPYKIIWEVTKSGKSKLLHNNLAFNILIDQAFITLGDEKPEILYYEEGVYKTGGSKFIAELVQEKTNGCVKNHDVQEVIGQIKRQTNIEREEIDKEPLEYINLRNGVLNIKTLELTPHNSKRVFIQQFPLNYNSKADCPKIKKFLKEVLDEQDIPLIEEFLGFLLYREYFIKKALIFVGERDSGKTTLINLIVKFIGEKNCSGISLHKILTDKFACYYMYGKNLNFYDDLSLKDIKNPEMFKIATGGGYLPAEKKFGECFHFMNYAKLLFATNQICAVETDDLAYYERWLIIFFNNIFDKDNPKTDKHLIEKITSEEELSGLLNLAITGLHRLLKNSFFTYPYTAGENQKVMEANADGISAFIQDCLEEQVGKWLSKKDLYQIYRLYAIKHGHPLVTKDRFGKKIHKKVKWIIEAQRDTENKKGVHGWLNLGINTSFTDYFQILYNKKYSFDIPKNKECKNKKLERFDDSKKKSAKPVFNEENHTSTPPDSEYLDVEEEVVGE